MTCSICIKHKKDSVFTTKNTNFKTTTLVIHADSKEHKDAVQADLLSRQYVKVLGERVDSLMTIKLESGEIKDFDFVEVLKFLRSAKQRKIFN